MPGDNNGEENGSENGSNTDPGDSETEFEYEWDKFPVPVSAGTGMNGNYRVSRMTLTILLTVITKVILKRNGPIITMPTGQDQLLQYGREIIFLSQMVVCELKPVDLTM